MPRSARPALGTRPAVRSALNPEDYRYLGRDLRQVVLVAGSIIAALFVLWLLRQAGVVTLV
jgi:hypothetical protein